VVTRSEAVVDLPSVLGWLQETGLATRIRDSLLVFPLLESAHVIGLAVLFGTIAVIDLRLLGLASTARSFSRMASDVMKWAWAAFAVTAVTGSLMFITNAQVYFHNAYFRAKIVLLVLAAINVLVFELTSARTIQRWDRDPSAPPVGRAVAALSLVIWIAVIFAGRMIGFTATRTSEPAPIDLNFEELLGIPADGGQSPGNPPPNK
jgi:uncharacterized membrane protein